MVDYANTPYASLDLPRLAAYAEKIYNEQYRPEFEKKYWGQYAFVDVKSGKAFVGKTEEEARTNARCNAPNGFFMPFGIGFDASERLLTIPTHG